MSQPATDPGFGVFVTDQPATGNAVGALPDPSLGDVIGAHWTVGRQETAGYDEQAVTDAYGPVVNALLAAHGQPTDRYIAVGPANPVNTGALWADIAAARKANPGFLQDIPASNDSEFQAWVHKQEAERRARAQRVISRQSGAPAAIAGFGADIAAGMTDPINLGAMVLTGGGSGAGRTVVQTMAREALVNAGIETAQLPNRAAVRASYGEDMSATDMAKDVFFAGVGGAAFGGALHVAGKGIGAAADAGYVPGFSPEQRVARALAAAKVPPVTDAEVLDHFTGTTPPDRWTPDQTAAVHVLTRQREVDQSNPFVPTPAGMDAHVQRLDAAIADIDRALKLDDAAPASPAPPASGFSGVRAVAQRIIGHESSGRAGARNPKSTATGLGQFTEGTWLRFAAANPDLVPKSLTREQKLAMRTDPVVSTAMTERAVASYVDTLRRGGAPVTDGNVYLAHFLGEDGALKVLRAEPDTPVSALLDAKAIAKNKAWLEGKTAGELVADMDRRMGGSGQPSMGAPVLDRAGFDSDAEWQTAQAALDAQHEREAVQAPEDVLDVPSDRYLAGEGRDDTEMQQFAANNAPAIEEEFQRRAAQPEAAAPMAQDEPPSISAEIDEDGEPIKQVRTRRRGPPQRKGPVDVITFLADRGGIRDDEGHALGREGRGSRPGLIRSGRDLQRFVPGSGMLIRKTGMSIDDAGELLHEAGYFPGEERPSVAEVLDLLERAHREKVYTPAEQAEVDARAAAEAEQGREAQERAALTDAARARGFDLEAEHIDRAMELVRHGIDHDDALMISAAERGNERIADLEPPVDDRDHADAFLDTLSAGAAESYERAVAEGRFGPEADTRAEGGRGREPPQYGDPDEGARLDDAQAAGDTGPLPDDPQAIAETAAAFDDEAGPAATAQSDSIEHDLAMWVDAEEKEAQRLLDEAAIADDASDLSIYRGGDEKSGAIGWDDLKPEIAEMRVRKEPPSDWPPAPEPEPAALDRGAEVDPAIAERQRQQAELGAKAPMRGKAEQDGAMGLGLFDAADQPGFQLTDDGKPVSFEEAMKAADSDLDAIEKARACMAPPGKGDA